MCHPEPTFGRRTLWAALLLGLLALLAALIMTLVLRNWRSRSGLPAGAEENSGFPSSSSLDPAASVSGWSEVKSTVGKDCLIVASNRAAVGSAEGKVLLWYEGTPQEADLIVSSCGVNSGRHHTIYLNGSPVAWVQDDAHRTCICGGKARPTRYRLSDSSPVISGWNYISITNDADILDSWMAYDLQLVIRGDLVQVTVEEFTFVSSYDGSLRRAVYQVPIGHNPAVAAPLLVSIGGTLEDRWDALSRFTHRANVRGWLLMAPDVRQARGDQLGRSASLGTQHDIIDAIRYMQSHFNVDADRIYMSGFSTGGGVAATVAAKYPDVFAAVVVWKPPTSLTEWIRQRPDLAWGLTTYDIGCAPQNGPTACPFEWQRRSARELVMNLKHVPMAIVHGRVDTRVPFSQSTDFYNAMAAFYDPLAHDKLAVWHDGGHVDWLPTFEGLDFMAHYTRKKRPTDIMIRTDESKGYYWLGISQQAWNQATVEGFTRAVASYDWASGVISVSVWDERALDGASLPVEVTLDLQAMGLNPYTAYIVEDRHQALGEPSARYELLPIEGRLILSVPRERLDRAQHHYLLYPAPARSSTRSLAVLRMKEGPPSAMDASLAQASQGSLVLDEAEE